MKKYNNISNHMNFVIVLTNIIYPLLIVFFATKEQSINTIIPMIMFILLIGVINFVFFYLIDQWYFTYFDEYKIIQKWLSRRKQIVFDEVKYIYFVNNLLFLSNKFYDLDTSCINLKTRRKTIRVLKNEICIIINVYDKTFPKMLLSKCSNATKIVYECKVKIYRDMFELD